MRQISNKVKNEYDGVGPNYSTIKRYVDANHVGMSPLKHGVKGDVPLPLFKSQFRSNSAAKLSPERDYV